MEKKSSIYLLSSELITFIILEFIISFFSKALKLTSTCLYIFSHSSTTRVEQQALKSHQAANAMTEQEINLRREDIELAMKMMGLMKEGDKFEELLGSEEVASLFEDKEPSLKEVKEAFEVFDSNGDGFVDAWELQRVLCNLGFVREVGLDQCQKMISLHDSNRDGRIEFWEFARLMENSLC